MNIRLTTLGGLRVVCDDRELDWLPAQRARAALLVYMAVERRVSRASVATVFWPDSTEARARQSLRQGLYHLRKLLGEDWLESQAHELRIGSRLQVDASAFGAAAARGDPATAARVYGGPFLDGVNLLDLKPWESWVDRWRAQYARDFRRVCREWVAARHAAGDVAGAVEAARWWLRPDPFDDEAQHRLIQALLGAGERAEAIRQYELYVRLLESDGLRPLAETVQLIDRARTAGGALQSAHLNAPSRHGQARQHDRIEGDVDRGGPAGGATQEHSEHDGDGVGPLVIAEREAPPSTVRRSPAAWRLAPRRSTRALLVAGMMLALMGAAWLAEARLFPPVLALLASDDVMERNDVIILADFGGPASDPALGVIVTDALRADLGSADAVRVLDAAAVADVLQRMQAAESAALTAELAREVALRHGAKAVLAGHVAQVGSGWVLAATLRSAASGRSIASFRETARVPDDLIPAIDRLSRAIRRAAGESLRDVEASPGLAQVTTASLDALRVYGEAVRTFNRRDYHLATALLEDALALDPEFAMAWRLLAAALSNSAADRVRQVHASTRAWELRQRLPLRERHLAAAAYHHNVTREWETAIEHYRRVLELEPDDVAALNNLALLLRRAGDFEGAAALLRKATARPRPQALQYLNLVSTQLAAGHLAEAARAADALNTQHRDAVAAVEAQFAVLLHGGDVAGARTRVEALLAAGRSPRERALAHDRLARLALWRGRLAEAREHFEAAERIVREAGPPHNPFAWRISHAFAEAVLGDPRRATGLLASAAHDGLLADLRPTELHHAHQALVHAMAGNLDDADAVLRRFIAEVPLELQSGYRPHIDAARAVLALRRDAPDEAVQILENMRVAEGCRYCCAALMGWALGEAGRLRDAAAEWEDALAGRDTFEEIGSSMVLSAWILQRLPAVYEQLGDTAAAVDHHRRLVDLWGHADPELQPSVRQAQARIRELAPARRRSPLHRSTVLPSSVLEALAFAMLPRPRRAEVTITRRQGRNQRE
jgi:DNA-binding SARP family transcriptional activator/Tfp pilus assembly protein PilF